jgi:16S rRNA (cytosine967-C5)-methyltransferase
VTPSSPPLARLLDLSADAVMAVRDGRSLNDVLARVAPDARPGVQALSFHVLRWLGGAEAVRDIAAPKHPPPKVDALLLTALALLWPTGEEPPYADHTLVDQAVAAARHRTPAAAGFVNAVLRRFLRERDALVTAAQRSPEGAFNHPLWWIERVRQDWPAQWQALLQQANRHPPMTLRVNVQRGTGSAYVERLAAQGQGARLLGDPLLGGQAVVLHRPCPVTALPGFAAGEVSVQDAAAQRAAPLLLGAMAPDLAPLPSGARVLDACAAPGGKTAHLLECRPDLDLLALDSGPQRLTRVHDTLQRLQPAAGSATPPRLSAADARDTARWWDGRPFDAILLDAPCSASGIVRRHPDVRWLRRADDIVNLTRLQAALLHTLWPLLAPGGRLLYATCSLFRAEGEQQIDAFLQRQPPGSVRREPSAPGHLLPLADNGGVAEDGFFYALLTRP